MSKTSLLLVEDNPSDARLLREMLDEQGAHGIDVTLVESMTDAEKHLAVHPVDIILLDLEVPDAKGLRAVRRAHAAAPRVPLVVLTGSADESLAEQALQEGAQDYFIKGQIEARGLLRALRFATARKGLEARYRNLMEHANDAILLFEPGFRILEANRRAEELLGCPREQIVGRSYESLIAPEDRSWLAADRAMFLSEGANRIQDRRLLRMDGSVVSVDVSASTIRLGDETVVLAILHDTSERKRTERELNAATKRLHYLVSENPSVIYALRIQGAIRSLAWISENVERLLGYTVQEALTPEWWVDHLHPDDRAKVLAEVEGILAHGRLIQEYRFRHRDGTYLWLRDEKRVLRDHTGHPAEAVGSLSDVTVRKSAERRLRESEEEYRLLFDSNPHPIWVYDVETLRYLAVNDAAVALYGYSRDEFLGMTVKEIFPPEEMPAVLEYLRTMQDRPTVTGRPWKHRKKDGTILEVAGVSNAIAFLGRRARLVQANDVSDRKRLERQLAQSQKMEAVGRLAGGVAHDFNNLLAVITGYSELLLNNLGPQHPGAKRVVQIQKAAERAAGLTRQLLAFSRKQVLLPRILDLNEVVADVGKMLLRVIGEDIQLVTTPGAGLGRIRADPGQIEQVLMNLAVNARDAMPKGGGLRIETANIALDDTYARAHPEVQPGRFVMLTVSDTGEGMDAQTLAHIFEPFFTTKEEGKGTGLGLATVFGIVQQSGGSITFSSQLGIGTTCTIYFPLVEDELPRPFHDPPGAPPPRGVETVLLVEDADSLRVMIRELLEGAGYTVLESSDPEEALLRISAMDAPVQLMLTDVVMPRMSGPDLAKSVRIARPEIKVLFMSGYTDEAMGLHGVLGAGTRFLQKPFTVDALFRKIREVLDEA